MIQGGSTCRLGLLRRNLLPEFIDVFVRLPYMTLAEKGQAEEKGGEQLPPDGARDVLRSVQEPMDIHGVPLPWLVVVVPLPGKRTLDANEADGFCQVERAQFSKKNPAKNGPGRGPEKRFPEIVSG
jgi:hypothetical protein